MKFYLGCIFLITAISIVSNGFGYPQSQGKLNVAKAEQTEDDSDMFMEADDKDEQQTAQQSFYPSFSPFQNPPLGHSRPFYFNNQQEGAYSQRQSNGFNQQQLSPFDSPRYSGYKDSTGYATQQNTDKLGLLGSGNFGVIKGGTYYSKDNDGDSTSNNYENDYDYFGNGHGGPSSYFGGGRGVPNPKPHKHEQFANFRDFADISSPANSAYSEYVVVYANRNGTKQNSVDKRPKNIIESLALLDIESSATTEEVPVKKLSKSKRKLAKLTPEKKHLQKLKAKSENNEPLLALS